MIKPDGGPAYPGWHNAGNTGQAMSQWSEGMTLRDYFAGQALVGLIVASPYTGSGLYAPAAYELAEAMLKERDKA